MNAPTRLTPLGQRIRAGMISAGIAHSSKLARKVGVSPQTVSRWLYQANTTIEASALFVLADTLMLSARWIAHGAGPPTRRETVTPSESMLLSQFRALAPQQRSILLHAARNLMDL